MKATTLTVVIPTVGRVGALGDLLHDLEKQQAPATEVLVVDAMRAMECRDLCARWRNERPTLPLRHLPAPPEESGLPASRNLAVRASGGELVAFLDDDVRLPEDYLRRLREPFADPAIMGVGGYITNEVGWEEDPEGPVQSPKVEGGWYRMGGQRRRLPARWRWRHRLGLARLAPPGRFLAEGHAWPLGFWPPGDDWVDVDFLMGGASAWRREAFLEHRFPSELEGYGHYEDLVFSLQVSRHHRLVLHRGARLEHHHHPAGRPDFYRYGYQVTYHGYSLWRQWTPHRTPRTEAIFWAVEGFNAIARLRTRGGFAESRGRLAGAVAALRRPIVFATEGALP